MQLRAKRTEAPANLGGLQSAMVLHGAETERFVDLPWCPASPPGPELRPFDGPCAQDYAAFGWQPLGEVRCQYSAPANNDGATYEERSLQVHARCDLDGDGTMATYEGSQEEAYVVTTPNNVY